MNVGLEVRQLKEVNAVFQLTSWKKNWCRKATLMPLYDGTLYDRVPRH